MGWKDPWRGQGRGAGERVLTPRALVIYSRRKWVSSQPSWLVCRLAVCVCVRARV